MARVEASEVKVFFNTELADSVVEAHIDVANELVTSVLGSSGLGDTRLKNIELYISAHLLSFRDPLTGAVAAEWIASEAKIEFSANFGQQLKSTHFGQQALVLDTTGTLATLGEQRARFRAF